MSSHGPSRCRSGRSARRSRSASGRTIVTPTRSPEGSWRVVVLHPSGHRMRRRVERREQALGWQAELHGHESIDVSRRVRRPAVGLGALTPLVPPAPGSRAWAAGRSATTGSGRSRQTPARAPPASRATAPSACSSALSRPWGRAPDAAAAACRARGARSPTAPPALARVRPVRDRGTQSPRCEPPDRADEHHERHAGQHRLGRDRFDPEPRCPPPVNSISAVSATTTPARRRSFAGAARLGSAAVGDVHERGHLAVDDACEAPSPRARRRLRPGARSTPARPPNVSRPTAASAAPPPPPGARHASSRYRPTLKPGASRVMSPSAATAERMYLITSRSGKMPAFRHEDQHVEHDEREVLLQDRLRALVLRTSPATSRPGSARNRLGSESASEVASLKNASAIASTSARV